jgi:hypothetical protein
MPRKAPLEFPGAVYQLLDRGVRREAMFRDDRDRKRSRAGMNDSAVNSGIIPHPGDGGPSGGPIPPGEQTQTISYDANGNLISYKA